VRRPPSGNSAPNGGCEHDDHRHLQRPGKAAICRERKPDSDFVSNNYLELYCNHLE
jgi:hypothetical protein